MYLQQQSGSENQITMFREIPTNQNFYSSRVHWKFLNYKVLFGQIQFIQYVTQCIFHPSKLAHKAHTSKF